MHRQLRTPSRWLWLAPALSAVLVASCDTTLQGVGRQDTWGFVILDATKSQSGAHFTAPEGLFFRGNLASVPNANYTTEDTCADGFFSEGSNSLSGVTHIDAGASLEAILSGTTNTLERTTRDDGLAYLLPGGATTEYNPGDSIFVTIPGAEGGYPAATVSAKTAEAFEFPEIIPPGGTETIQVNWTIPHNPSSAMIVSLRYMSPGSNVFDRHLLCTFLDDGADSIPFRWYENWAASAGERAVVATRLRTYYVGVGNANLGVISTYRVPTPPQP